MKKSILIISVFTVAFSNAQTKKTTATKKAVTTKTVSASPKGSIDSFSYALGINIASNLKTQGIEQINFSSLQKAMNDVFTKQKLLLTEDQTKMAIQNKLAAFMNNKLAATKEEGRKFLAENKKRKGVIELPGGLQYEIIKQGNGPIPKATDTVRAHYAGTLITGQEFDNSYKRGEPIQIPVTGVIQGWVQALQMMPVGSKWKLYIPSNLGYGDQGAGGAIPGGAVLIFDIELLDIVHNNHK